MKFLVASLFLIYSEFVSGHLYNMYANKDICSKINNTDTCVNNIDCVWCNNTNKMPKGCSKIIPCDFVIDENKYENCTIPKEKKYLLECQIMYALFYFLIIISFYFSLLSIFGKINIIMVNENLSSQSKKTINGIILLLIAVPIFVIFFIEPLTFYFVYISYILVAIFAHCCCNPKLDHGHYSPALINNDYRTRTDSVYEK